MTVMHTLSPPRWIISCFTSMCFAPAVPLAPELQLTCCSIASRPDAHVQPRSWIAAHHAPLNSVCSSLAMVLWKVIHPTPSQHHCQAGVVWGRLCRCVLHCAQAAHTLPYVVGARRSDTNSCCDSHLYVEPPPLGEFMFHFHMLRSCSAIAIAIAMAIANNEPTQVQVVHAGSKYLLVGCLAGSLLVATLFCSDTGAILDVLPILCEKGKI
jgi:hypothetical protein